MLNKWDYRYPYFGLQKLHMGYGYGYPIYPQVSKHKDFMSLVNRLENRMSNIEDNVSNISQDVVDELHALLQQFNEIDTIISVDDVQLIVESAIDNIEYPEYITIDAVNNEITRAINEIDLGLSALEVQAMISDSIDELDVGLSEAQVMVLIHESLAMIDTGLNYTQVQDLIALTLANLDVGMTEDDVADLIQFHIQSIPIDSIQSEIASLRATVETLDVPDVDLSDVYSRLLLLESQVDEDTIYDDEWIHTEIQTLNDLIDSIEVDGVDFTPIWSSIDDLQGQIDGLDVGGGGGDGGDLSDYVRHDYLANEELSMLQFTPNQSPQTYQIELPESTVDVYINLTGLSTNSLDLEIHYSHLDVDEQSELEELLINTSFNLININVFANGNQLNFNNDSFGANGYSHDGIFYMSIYDLGNLVYEFPLYSSGDSIPLTISFDMNHYDYYNDYQPAPEQSISIVHDMNISWVFIENVATPEFSDIISTSLMVKNNSEQVSEMINTVWNLEQRLNETPHNDYVNALENRIIELENRLDNLIIPDSQTNDVAIVRPQGPEVYPERPDTELAIYIGPWEPDKYQMLNGDMWYDNTNNVYRYFNGDYYTDMKPIGGVSKYRYNSDTSSYPEKIPGEMAIYYGLHEPPMEASLGDLWIKTGVSQPLHIRYMKPLEDGTGSVSGWFNFDSEVFSTNQPPE